MFNKRESSTHADGSTSSSGDEPRLGVEAVGDKPVRDVPPAGDRRGPAVIGPSIHIEGDLRGEEDLVIEGEVKGTVKLKNNSVTIGARGKVAADVYAHTIYVEGSMTGDLFASERLSIRKNAQVRGNITSPRVSLEDGAHFKGSIEMDPEAEALKAAFGDARKKSGGQGESTPSAPAGAAAGQGAGSSAKSSETSKASTDKDKAASPGTAETNRKASTG